MAMTVEQAYQILSKFHGYTGPRTKRGISQFINARDLPVAVKNRGGLIGMQEGGDTEKKEKPSGESELWQMPDIGGFFATALTYDLGKLKHLEEYGIDLEKI